MNSTHGEVIRLYRRMRFRNLFDIFRRTHEFEEFYCTVKFIGFSK